MSPAPIRTATGSDVGEAFDKGVDVDGDGDGDGDGESVGLSEGERLGDAPVSTPDGTDSDSPLEAGGVSPVAQPTTSTAARTVPNRSRCPMNPLGRSTKPPS
jgi:hypothetical protein